MPVDKVVPLIRAGRLQDAAKICLDDHAQTPGLLDTLGDNDESRWLVDHMNNGHIEEMIWIATAAAKEGNWQQVTHFAKMILDMPGLDDQKLDMVGYLIISGSSIEEILAKNPTIDRSAANGAKEYARNLIEKSLVPMAEESMREAMANAKQTNTPETSSSYTPAPSSDKRCFIATAVYTPVDIGKIDTLRAYRDRVLLKSAIGTAVVRLYYRVSPGIAAIIAKSASLKYIVRIVLLDPIVSLIARQ